MKNIDNWSQLDLFAALIMACDEVISIDNSTVHFAGALGKSVMFCCLLLRIGGGDCLVKKIVIGMIHLGCTGKPNPVNGRVHLIL